MKPLLMLSLPNSGSTWLAAVIARNMPGCRYVEEFFNPLRNPKHEAVLSRQFGCELAGCFGNIAEPGDAAIDGDIRATWGAERYTFTKEVFSPLKLPAFARHFRCFVLLRDAASTFPPTRLRVWSFYEHAWHALLRREIDPGGADVRSRARLAHAWLSDRLRNDAAQLGVPIVEHAELMAASERTVAEMLDAAAGCPRAASDVVATREAIPRRPERVAA